MLGAIIGDIVGSKFEWTENKEKEFPFLSKGCTFTDDSIMTLAIARAFSLRKGKWFDANFQEYVIEKMVDLGKEYSYMNVGERISISGLWEITNHTTVSAMVQV